MQTVHLVASSIAIALASGCKFPELPPVAVDAASDGGVQHTLTVTTQGPGTVSSTPAGISCMDTTCAAMFSADQDVQLTALPDADSTFAGFTGACNTPALQCSVAMSADRTVMASFVANDCEPDTVTCMQGILNRCDSNGVSHPEVCLLGCEPSGTRCYDLAPSNVGMTMCLDGAAVEADASIPDGATIDTDSGAVTVIGGGTLTIPSETIEAPVGGVQVRCFRANNLTIGSVAVIGTRAFALAANGDIVVTGNISVGARAYDVPGPGHFSNPTTCNGGNYTTGGLVLAGGGGGGGFGAAGGGGGSGGNGSMGGAPGSASGNPELVPLRGGCSGGGNEPAGMTVRLNAGGATQMVSRTAITFMPNAGVSASGWGGGSSATVVSANRGGGSGGAILLEAPMVSLPAQAFLVANGGGGGGKDPGMPGGISTIGGAGGPGGDDQTTSYGAGGRGGALLNAVFGSPSSGRGGGGGGAAGRIRVNAYNVFVPGPASVVSPTPTTGAPGRR